MKKQKKNSHEGITWSEMGKQNVQAEKVYWSSLIRFLPACASKRCLPIAEYCVQQCWQCVSEDVGLYNHFRRRIDLVFEPDGAH